MTELLLAPQNIQELPVYQQLQIEPTLVAEPVDWAMYAADIGDLNAAKAILATAAHTDIAHRRTALRHFGYSDLYGIATDASQQPMPLHQTILHRIDDFRLGSKNIEELPELVSILKAVAKTNLVEDEALIDPETQLTYSELDLCAIEIFKVVGTTNPQKALQLYLDISPYKGRSQNELAEKFMYLMERMRANKNGKRAWSLRYATRTENVLNVVKSGLYNVAINKRNKFLGVEEDEDSSTVSEELCWQTTRLAQSTCRGFLKYKVQKGDHDSFRNATVLKLASLGDLYIFDDAATKRYISQTLDFYEQPYGDSYLKLNARARTTLGDITRLIFERKDTANLARLIAILQSPTFTEHCQERPTWRSYTDRQAKDKAEEFYEHTRQFLVASAGGAVLALASATQNEEHAAILAAYNSNLLQRAGDRLAQAEAELAAKQQDFLHASTGQQHFDDLVQDATDVANRLIMTSQKAALQKSLEEIQARATSVFGESSTQSVITAVRNL